MKSTNYSDKVLDHFRNPRNTGILEGDDVALGRVGNPVCGDLMEIYIKVKDDIIEDIKFQTFGCGSAVATSSMVTEMVKGKNLDEALKVSRKDVAEELDGLPPIKMHCSNLAADALHAAIDNYRSDIKNGGERIDVSCGTCDTACEDEDDSSEKSEKIKGLEKYKDEGVYTTIDDYEIFRNLRVLIVDLGDPTIKLAIELTKYTGRVVFTTFKKKISTIDPNLKKEIIQSDVKILYESDVLEITGEGEVEKIILNNLDEDEKFELFVDAIIYLKI